MRISLNITDYSYDSIRDGLAAVVSAADEAGIDTVWVSDHLVQADPTASFDDPMLEAYTTLGHLAALTHRVRLGAMVTPATFRSPALLVKAVTTLDVLSGGRAWLGLGAGYQQEEARAMGLDLPPVTERFERLEETLQIADRMWSGDESPFEGHHYRLERPLGNPRPVRRPKILIGGAGETKTLKLVARYADACNLFDVPGVIPHKLEVLAGHCEAVGRPYEEIEKTVATRAETLPDRIDDLAAQGIEHAVLITRGPWTPDQVVALAPFVEKIAP
ncbi:MAG: LLM class F420-dependent oxidoreductase [Nonomuraea sp.]|nr:LLM class F420-dependent oxidoreductase [Nonomuraea sp.]NUP82852.1 LLM class F420-dependent oxidoreductase [Nonomuraea sp.]